jgi:flagellin
MVQRARELTVQAANGTNTDEDRAKIVAEINQLASEVTSMVGRVEFNGMKLLDIKEMSNVSFQVGANEGQLTKVSFKYDLQKNVAAKMITAAEKISLAGNTVAGSSEISKELTNLADALKEVTNFRATLGASQNRLDYTIKSLDISSENLSASESRIRDADMAKEMMTLTKSNVLQQAAMSMLTQANQAPQGILQLLR